MHSSQYLDFLPVVEYVESMAAGLSLFVHTTVFHSCHLVSRLDHASRISAQGSRLASRVLSADHTSRIFPPGSSLPDSLPDLPSRIPPPRSPLPDLPSRISPRASRLANLASHRHAPRAQTWKAFLRACFLKCNTICFRFQKHMYFRIEVKREQSNGGSSQI